MKKICVLAITVMLIYQLNAQRKNPFIINESNETYTTTLIAKWGNDTAAIETFTLVGNHLMGEALHLYPEPHKKIFRFWYNDDGSLKEYEFRFHHPDNPTLPLKSKTGFLPIMSKAATNDKVFNSRNVGFNGRESQYIHDIRRLDFVGGWIPILGQLEWLAQQHKKTGDRHDLVFINAWLGPYEMSVYQKSEGELIFDSGITKPISLFLDDEYHIDSIDALGTPWNYEVSRHEPTDLAQYYKQFANKKVIGDPSPHDQVTKEVAGVNMYFDYGRPSKRGRVIFGNVVPYGQVWRTGAGDVTTWSFDKDLIFDGQRIPKGKYNIYTVPEKTSWTLIFNIEDQAWGSAHRPAFDKYKVQMKRHPTDSLVEKFTVDFQEKQNGGVIKMSWEGTTASASFKVADQS